MLSKFGSAPRSVASPCSEEHRPTFEFPSAMQRRSGAKGSGRNTTAEAARRAEAAAVKADPHWIRHLNRNQTLTAQLYAYVSADGRFTDQGHELANLRTMKGLMSCENDEMLNRPAFGISEKAGSTRVALENLNSHLEKRTNLLNVDLMKRRLAPFLEVMPALEKLDNTRGYERAADLTAALQDVTDLAKTTVADSKSILFLQNMKFIGLQMYEAAVNLETLLAPMGDPAWFRENLGHVDRQDPKLAQWPLGAASDSARMINFLRASMERRRANDAKRRPAATTGGDALGDLDSDIEVDPMPAEELSEADLEPAPAPKQEPTKDVKKKGKTEIQAPPSKRAKTEPATDPEITDIKAQLAMLMTAVSALTQSKEQNASRPSSAKINIEEEMQAAAKAGTELPGAQPITEDISESMKAAKKIAKHTVFPSEDEAAVQEEISQFSPIEALKVAKRRPRRT